MNLATQFAQNRFNAQHQHLSSERRVRDVIAYLRNAKLKVADVEDFCPAWKTLKRRHLLQTAMKAHQKALKRGCTPLEAAKAVGRAVALIGGNLSDVGSACGVYFDCTTRRSRYLMLHA